MLREIKEVYERTRFCFDEHKKLEESFWPLNWIKIFFKTYPRFPKVKIELSQNKDNLVETLFKRESIREFTDVPLSFLDVSEIIYFSVGLKEKKESYDQTRRFYPSAGARYPIETYLIANNIDSLPMGLYHFSVKNNELEELLKKDIREESKEIFGREIGENNPNFLILSSVMSRSEAKYGTSAYRFSLIECGHIGQNIALLAARKEIGCCSLGGFDDERLSKLLDFGEDEIPLYAFVLGEIRR